MDGWKTRSPTFPSFMDIFEEISVPPPPDLTTSTRLKKLGPDEIEVTGPSFHKLEKLDLDRLQIDLCTLSWAKDLLAQYGPTPETRLGNEYWHTESITIRADIDSIKSELDTAVFFQEAVIMPALAAASFLHAQHACLETDRCPGGKWKIENTSTAGKPGRPDRVIVRRTDSIANKEPKPAVVFEAKTLRACHSVGRPKDVLVRLGALLKQDVQFAMDREGRTPNNRPPGDLNWYEEHWKIKVQQIFFQVWNQLITKRCRHAVVFNENGYFVGYRRDHTLYLSEYFSTNPATEERQHTRSTLAFFFAHAMLDRFPGDKYQPVDDLQTQSLTTHVNLKNDNENKDGGGSGSRPTTSSEIKDFILSLTQGVTSSFTFPGYLIFTTSGVPSQPFKLLNNQPTWKKLVSRPVVLTQFVHFGEQSNTFRGSFMGIPIIGKLANVDPHHLETEFLVYQQLKLLQGSVIPRCFGLHEIVGFTSVLLIEDCGMSLGSFDELSLSQRESLLNKLIAIHRSGVIHNDLEPRNVVASASGGIRIVDFELSQVHECPGEELCEEIIDLTDKLCLNDTVTS